MADDEKGLDRFTPRFDELDKKIEAALSDMRVFMARWEGLLGRESESDRTESEKEGEASEAPAVHSPHGRTRRQNARRESDYAGTSEQANEPDSDESEPTDPGPPPPDTKPRPPHFYFRKWGE